MTYAISVPTPFSDISELAESFYSRVDEERLMLPNSDNIPEGEWVDFHVTLADGSAALVGQGRCTSSIDNGEDRAPEHRFDVVIDSLQMEEMAQVYFQQILQVRAAYAGEEAQEYEVAGAPGEAGAEYAEAPADYAEAPVGYAEPPAQSAEYAEAPVGYAEPPAQSAEYTEAPPEHAGAPTEAPPYEAPPYTEAAPELRDGGAEIDYAGDPINADELIESVPAPDVEEALAWEEESNVTELGSIEEYRSVEQPLLNAPAESKIYELPPPAAPGALPSPHAVAEVLTRPSLHASWSPEPVPRPEPSPSTGYFQIAVGAGLPLPEAPPTVEVDPSLHLAPAPRPGAPMAAPELATAQEYAEPEADVYAQVEADQTAGEYAEPHDAAAAPDVEAGYTQPPEYAEAASTDAYPAEAGDPAGVAEYAEPAEYVEPEYAEPEYAEPAEYDGEFGEAAEQPAEYAEAAEPVGYAEPEYAEPLGHEGVETGQPLETDHAEYPTEAAEGEYAEASLGLSDDATLDAASHGAVLDATRQVDVSALPTDDVFDEEGELPAD